MHGLIITIVSSRNLFIFTCIVVYHFLSSSVALMELPKKKISIITPPVFSPKLKKKSLTSYDSMMNAVMALFSADTDNTLLRSCSMPDLISDSIEDSPAAIRNSLVSRKISVPASVFMMTSRNTGSKR